MRENYVGLYKGLSELSRFVQVREKELRDIIEQQEQEGRNK